MGRLADTGGAGDYDIRLRPCSSHSDSVSLKNVVVCEFES